MMTSQEIQYGGRPPYSITIH